MSQPDAAHDGPAVVVRSAADVLRLVVAGIAVVVLLLVEALFGGTIVGFASDLLRGLDAFDETVVTTVVVLARTAGVALLLAGLVAVVLAGRWRLLATAGLGIGASIAVFAIAERWIDERGPSLAELSDTVGPLTSLEFPTSVGLAAAAGTLTASAPWLSRRWRRIGWALVLVLALARFVVAPVSSLALASLLSGWTGGALALVVLGGPVRRPHGDAILSGLRSVGLEVAELEPAAVDARGSTPYFGRTADGRGLFVKVLGRDERSADLLFRLYRMVLPRDLGDERPFSSLRRAVEHEALVALSADRLGVRTPGVAALCDAEPGGFVLAYEAVDGRSLDRVEEAELSDDVLREVWTQLALLRRHRVAHRDLRLANVFLARDGSVWLIDFGFAELAASDLLLATDLAELLASLSSKVGARRATQLGVAVMGHADVATALPRLRPGFLSGATRAAVKEQPELLGALRQEIVAAGPAVLDEPEAVGGR